MSQTFFRLNKNAKLFAGPSVDSFVRGTVTDDNAAPVRLLSGDILPGGFLAVSRDGQNIEFVRVQDGQLADPPPPGLHPVYSTVLSGLAADRPHLAQQLGGAAPQPVDRSGLNIVERVAVDYLSERQPDLAAAAADIYRGKK